MKLTDGGIRLSATDLSNHLHCEHLTALNLKEVRGELAAPAYRAPHLVVLQGRGFEHERAYLRDLAAQDLTIVDLSEASETAALRRTLEAMRAGVDVIVQAAFEEGRWFGRPDVLRRVEAGYEPYDCKLTKETKASSVLQLSHYASLLEAVQGKLPENVHVVTPVGAETYRTLDYAAYFRAVRGRLEAARDRGTYPEPTGHCEFCRWWTDCDRQRRRDDHLSLTAGVTRLQRKQLETWGRGTMALLAQMTIPIAERPQHGTRAGYERVREQARVQVQGRSQQRPVHELLEVEVGRGLTRLPKPSEGDLFFDLESDPFVGERGLEYLFGVVTGGEYLSRWAMSAAEEKAAFEWFVDFAMAQRVRFPGMHIYHYGHKEPSTLKALMGRYATRENEIDAMLRGGMLVDLHSIVKQGLRASVETYSLKAFEEFHEFRRDLALDLAKTAMRRVEHGLELGRGEEIEPEAKDRVAVYNRDDCLSTRSLRDWLEGLRAFPERPVVADGAPNDKVKAQQERTARLFAELTADIPVEGRTADQEARWLLANLLDWHRREEKVAYWEKYRLRDLPDDELEDERKVIAGLQHLRTLPPVGRERNSSDEYSFPAQEVAIQAGDEVHYLDTKIGKVTAIDNERVTIKKTGKAAGLHPPSVFAVDIVGTEVLADSLYRFASAMPPGAGRDLLLREPPRLKGGALLRMEGEAVGDAARRLVSCLDGTVLAIQGPPGAGKTYTGARMIVEAVRRGQRVGITAGSHKVIRKLVDDARKAAVEEGLVGFRCLLKVTDECDEGLPEWLEETKDNKIALDGVGKYSVVAGTAWLWAREDFAGALDVLFVDEAGQLSLANALAVAPAANNLVLLGDPQQLDQPLKGSHPEGAEVSALEHLLAGAKTIASDRGLFLDRTWRLHPQICAFTSEMFYEDRLQSRQGLEHQQLDGEPHLRFVAVKHEGNQNCSLEEVERIAQLVDELVGRDWVNDLQQKEPLTKQDILIVAPYNAQVAALKTRLPGVPVGTVDKFQGQEAPVVIYSLTTSSPEDAPRGMEFLYSLNRLNVATSRARALAIVVASPRLLEPDCQTPRQMQLANALCRFVELAGGAELVRTA